MWSSQLSSILPALPISLQIQTVSAGGCAELPPTPLEETGIPAYVLEYGKRLRTDLGCILTKHQRHCCGCIAKIHSDHRGLASRSCTQRQWWIGNQFGGRHRR